MSEKNKLQKHTFRGTPKKYIFKSYCRYVIHMHTFISVKNIKNAWEKFIPISQKWFPLRWKRINEGENLDFSVEFCLYKVRRGGEREREKKC